jgi:prepilin-type N-terminal cleavage/methylation domain-containing protein
MTTPRQNPRGFTLIELIVVVVILSVAAAVVMPRMFERGSRGAELSARSLAALVSAIGTRAALGGQRLALRYDARDNRVIPESWTFAGTPGDFSSQGEWANDRVLSPVTLEGLEVKWLTVDGSPITPASWRIESRQGAPAPVIAIGVGQPRAGRSWVIDLAPGSLRAHLRSADLPANATSAVDLDARGLDKEPW